MEAVFGLMLMLLGLCQGVVHKCDVTTNCTCYGALGGSVLLKMGSELKDRLKITKNVPIIFQWRNSVISTNKLKDRSVFEPEAGTLQINNLISSDADNYTFEIFDSNGRSVRLTSLQLFLQDPVKSVHFHTKCLSEGELRVSCSHVGGDSPHLQWTLNGSSLTDDKLISGNTQTNNITLRQDVSGTLRCSVTNKVSVVEASDKISTCGFIFINCTSTNETRISKWVYAANNTLCIEPTTAPTTPADTTVGKTTLPSTNITSSNQTVTSSGRDDHWFIPLLQLMGGVLAALIVLLMVGGVVVYTMRKKKSNNEKEEDDEQELTYQEVRFSSRRQVQPRVPRPGDEVEYGEIKFAERPQRTVGPTQDECVYAKVR